jgi:8-oxo-dGTP pyrophosphatase MutT (NUDIX family)
MKIWEGRRFAVIREDGYEIADTPDAVAIVAIDAQDRIVLVRQLRIAAGERLLELPAGLIDEGEEPVDTAKRELREETGLRGGSWRELTWFWSSPGFTNERVWVFEATGLEEGEPEPEAEEDLELVRWTLDEVEARLLEIVDATTLVGLLLHLRARR